MGSVQPLPLARSTVVHMHGVWARDRGTDLACKFLPGIMDFDIVPLLDSADALFVCRGISQLASWLDPLMRGPTCRAEAGTKFVCLAAPWVCTLII